MYTAEDVGPRYVVGSRISGDYVPLSYSRRQEIADRWNGVEPSAEVDFDMPELITSATSERYDSMPVMTDGSENRTVMYIPVPAPIAAGEVWDIEAEIHVTNDDLRSRGYGFALTSEVRIGYDSTHDRDGFYVCDASGSFNVGVEAHHGLINRRGLYQWEADEDTDRYIKFIIWASSTQAQSGDRCDITQNRGQLKLLRWVPT